MLFRSLYTRPAPTEWRSRIPNNSVMKIGSLLFSIGLSKYALIMSICSTSSPSSFDMTRNIFNDSRLTVDAKVLLKSMPGIWEYFWPMSLALYLLIDLLRCYFTLNTYFKPIAIQSLGSLSYSQVLYCSRLYSSSSMASHHCHSKIGLDTTSS